MTIYTRAIQTALRLLTKYGQTITVETNVPGVYDTATSSVAITTTSQEIKGAVFEWGGSNYPNNGQEVIDWTLIKSGDKKLILSTLANDGSSINKPNIGDVAIVQGIRYTMVNPIKFLAPAGVLVLVEVNIRGSA
jgi:hypothetical protein